MAVITDGGNADRHGTTLDRLLRILQQENDSARPVADFTITYGPSAI